MQSSHVCINLSFVPMVSPEVHRHFLASTAQGLLASPSNHEYPMIPQSTVSIRSVPFWCGQGGGPIGRCRHAATAGAEGAGELLQGVRDRGPHDRLRDQQDSSFREWQGPRSSHLSARGQLASPSPLIAGGTR
jgi:hypothetical protein